MVVVSNVVFVIDTIIVAFTILLSYRWRMHITITIDTVTIIINICVITIVIITVLLS